MGPACLAGTCQPACRRRPLSPAQAEQAAKTYIAVRYPATAAQPPQTLTAAGTSRLAIASSEEWKPTGDTVAFLIRLRPSGFILMRADDQLPPVKIYSEAGAFEALPPDFVSVLAYELAQELKYLDKIQQAGQPVRPEYANRWQALLAPTGPNDDALQCFAAATTQWGPLLTTTWNQGDPYNYYAPTAAGGPGGRAYAGCVACAMAQILRYHQAPVAIATNYTYTDVNSPCTGSHSASDAGLGAYNWANMPSSISSGSSTAQKQAIGQLMYHCGVTVNMDYESYSSGASSLRVVNAFRTFFGYNCDSYRNRADYTDAEWYDRMQADIAANLPVFYSMSAPNAGHAIVCDGCRNGNELHLNFGWSGSADAWYDMNAVNGGGYNWYAHGAVARIDDAGTWPTCELSVESGNPIAGVTIAVSPADQAGASNGTTAFTCTYATGTRVTLTAPATAFGNPFEHWDVDGLSQGTNLTVATTMTVSHSARACYTVGSAPSNDAFANATVLTAYEGTANANSTLAGVQSGEPAHAGQGPFKSVWWRFVAPGNGYFRADTHGTAWDTVMGVYTGAQVNALTPIASCDDDAYWPDSSISIYMRAGVTYAVAVAGCYSTEFGDVILHWVYVPAAGATHYVSRTGKHTPPFLSWREAATNIAAAIASAESGQIVLVTNGTYVLATPLTITNGITVRSMATDRPAATIIDGNQAVRCFYLQHSNAVVNGFTITRGAATKGAAVYIATNGTVQNCLIVSNTASLDGAGVYNDHGGRVQNCAIWNNAASGNGGGIFCNGGGGIENCTIVSNSAIGAAGGVSCDLSSSATNCIVYFNRAAADPNFSAAAGSRFSYGCTTPMPAGGHGVTDAPGFINAPAGDYRLRYGSAGIDAGTNLAAIGITNDLAGSRRPIGAGFDIGAYEYDPQSTDSDGDRMADEQEIIAGTSPTNPASFFQVAAVSNPAPDFLCCFLSATGRTYTLEWRTNLLSGVWTNRPEPGPISGNGGPMQFSTPTAPVQGFYRLRLTMP